MPLDPQMQVVLDQLTGVGLSFAGREVDQVRELMALVAEARLPVEPVAEVRELAIPGPAGPIQARLYHPAAGEARPLVVAYHGGGWVVGTLDGHEPVCRALANRSGCAIVSVDYRLAPEHRFPAAVEDADAAARWVAAHAEELGGAPGPIGVAGDSAGGNLAAVVALLARDRGSDPWIAHQLLIYPVTDTSGQWPSYEENGTGYFLTIEDMRWFIGHYLSAEADRQDVRVSPILAQDLAGLPPAFVVTAEFDPLRDEGNAYAERLRAAGVPATLRCYPGVVHGFFGMQALVDVAGHALDDAAAAVRDALRPEG